MNTPRDLERMLCDETAEPEALPLSLLKQITDDFSDKHIIGSGGFAVVYKGKLQNRNVAVKRISNTYLYEKEFQREVQCLMKVKHQNVVRFLGYCGDTQLSAAMYEGKFVLADVQQRLLCFEYVSKGSLQEYISDTTSGLQWSDRYHIIKGICQGLHYLHHTKILHLDLKPRNILLDGNLVAKIADFGLSRCFDVMQSRIITLNIRGTPGYLAPESANGEITNKLDIYSLGVLIIEILTGKKGYHAADEVVESWSNRLDESMSEVQLKQVRVCAEIGIECTDYNPKKRPDTQHIIYRLDETESMDRSIKTSVRQSRNMCSWEPRDLERMLCDETAEPEALPLSLLKQITDDFSDKHIIGSGGFAVVYKGKLENRNVAVKRMHNTYLYEKEFQREVECLMMVKHKNVLRFLGYCADTQGSAARHEGTFVMADVQQRLLCFEYVSKGSLREYISDTTCGLQWRHRYHIIQGICQGLHYLHHRNIVHLDLKPGNILLDGNLVAKIADFGLSRCFDATQTRFIPSKIGGTLPYLAPEFYDGEITNKFDIYSLGVLIIEILTGKKGHHDVDKVVESWSNRLEESMREVQLKQVRVCAEIGIACTDFNPKMRPYTQHIICRFDETESMDRYIETSVRQYELLFGAMHDLSLSYQRLHPNIRRCIEFCSMFPIGTVLRKYDLVRLWIAQEFVISTDRATVEYIAGGYIQELVSGSFLQPSGTGSDCYIIHEVLHDILYKVPGNCFRIENASSHGGDGWKGDVPPDIQHIFILNYDGDLISEKVLGLEKLRTLIVYAVGKAIEEKVIDSICKRLPKLRVLAIAFSEEYSAPIRESYSLPETIDQLKYLGYLAFRTKSYCKITLLPSTLNYLQHIQFLDFGG